MKSKLTLLMAALVLVFALLPQVFFWINGGSFGSYFVSNYDEPAYSAYVNALAAGKPRKYDPFLQQTSQNESLYSIQFIPAYSVALPLRLTGLSTSTGFIVLSAVIALLSFAALFWFLREATGNVPLAAVGSFAVLCFGTAVAFQGELRHLLTGSVLVDFFPFLRRYEPGLPFPLFFVFCGSVWKAVTGDDSKRRYIYSALAGVTFAALVFSYFYLWTAAAAWFVCFTFIVTLFNRELRIRALITAGLVGFCAAAALIPYFQMLGARASNIDAVQLLDRTHAPNLISSVFIAGIVLAAILLVAGRGIKILAEPLNILCLSFALTPAIILNQQVITGTSLQPVHYEIFIGNYVVLTAAVLLIFILLRERPVFSDVSGVPRPLVYVALAAAVWGFFEASSSATRASAAGALRDQSIAAIKEIASRPDADGAVVLGTNFVTADIIPTISTARPLWNADSSTAGGVGTDENKRLFYLFLYFSGYGSKDLADELRARSFEVTAAVFGSERALPSLASGASSITDADIRAEVANFDRFVTQIDGAAAHSPLISYAIIPAAGDVDLRPIDRWYACDAGVKKGIFMVYRLTPKQE